MVLKLGFWRLWTRIPRSDMGRKHNVLLKIIHAQPNSMNPIVTCCSFTDGLQTVVSQMVSKPLTVEIGLNWRQPDHLGLGCGSMSNLTASNPCSPH